MYKIVAENLQEYRELNQLNEAEQVNELLGIGGITDEQKNKAKELAGKPQLEDADVDANIKLITAILGTYKPTTLGNADACIKAIGILKADPKKYKQTLLNFIKVYVQSLSDNTKQKFYKLDTNKKLIPYLNTVKKAAVGTELGA